MAHKKGQGSTQNGRDSNSQRRGTKVYGGEVIRAGATVCNVPDTTGYGVPGQMRDLFRTLKERTP